jgi:hypothetical protein
MASVAERATTVWAMGIRKAASRALDSISLRFLRRSERAVSMTSRALSTDGGLRSDDRDEGVCTSSFWLR